MISSLSSIESWYDSYTKSFSSTDISVQGALRLKEDHCKRVMNEMAQLAHSLNLDKGNSQNALIAGLLHDIGRFEQFVKYKTFLDARSINHADLSVVIIEKSGILSVLDPESASSVIEAVRLHNKAVLPPSCDQLPKMLRDADKLDIWNVVITHFQNPDQSTKSAVELDLPDNDDISPITVKEILNGTPWNVKSLNSVNDFKLVLMGWVFDINFQHSFKEIKRREYLEKMLNVLPSCNEATSVYKTCRSHLERHV